MTDDSDKRIPTVKFDTSRVTDAVIAEIERCVREVEGLEEADREAIYAAALECVNRGGDLSVLFNALKSADIKGMTRRAMEDACRYIHRRAFAIIDREHFSAVGIEYAKWVYSGAPCVPQFESEGADYSRQDAAHKRANGKSFRVVDGLVLNGHQTWPGWERGCKCVFRAVIPGFS